MYDSSTKRVPVHSLAAMHCLLQPPAKACVTFFALQFWGLVYKHMLFQCSLRLANVHTRRTLEGKCVVCSVQMFLQVLWPEVLSTTIQTSMLLALGMHNHVSLQSIPVLEQLMTSITTSCLFDVNSCMQVTTFPYLESSQTVRICTGELVVNGFNMSLYSSFVLVHKISTEKTTEMTRSTWGHICSHLSLRNRLHIEFYIEVQRYTRRTQLLFASGVEHKAWQSA